MTIKKYFYRGEEFQIDDSKGCYVEVAYFDQVGYAGVNLQGTPELRFTWSTRTNRVTDEGIARTSYGYKTISEALDATRQELDRLHRQEQEHNRFNPDEACKELHEFVEGL